MCDHGNIKVKKHEHDHTGHAGHNHDHDHDHSSAAVSNEGLDWKGHWDLLLALAILIILLVLEYAFKLAIPKIPAFIINGIAWVLAGRNVLALAFRKSKRGDFFN